MSNKRILFKPVFLGDLELPNRVLMAPLTRNRAHSDGTPKDMAQTYYSQRASAGLIISEATQISAMGKGYLDTPGIYTRDHVEGWRKVTDSVHATGGRIFCQLWHVGRISHVSLLPEGRQPVSSTDRAAKSQTFTANGFEDCSKPVALDAEGIGQTLADFETAAKCAREAGFDGIEVHAANGYLIDQFLQSEVNDRSDSHGGTMENRMRLLEEALDAVGKHWPTNRTGVRLSPLGQANDVEDSDPAEHFSEVYSMLSKRGLAYLHVVEKFPGNDTDEQTSKIISKLRSLYNGFYIANGGYDADSGAKAVHEEHAQAITYGRPFIANPDLPQRYLLNSELNKPDQDTFYGGDEEGYIDYPFLNRV